MTPYPAIDLKEGVCVRLVQGDMARATVYNRDPVAQARTFESLGFTWLHVVDLDGAFAGRPVNRKAVEAILAETSARLQLGGGIRDLTTVEGWLDAGVTRVILGTAALSDPALVERAAARHPGRVALAIDARGGRVAVEGWARDSEVDALDLARRFEDSGIAAIVHTDIERDGKAAGVNVEATARLAAAVRVPVIASGGVASLDDLRALKAVADTGIEGVIVGRALYDGRLDGAAVLELLGS